MIISGTATNNSTTASNKCLFTSEAVLLVELLLLTSNTRLNEAVLAQCCKQTTDNGTRFNISLAGKLLPLLLVDSDGEVNSTTLEITRKQNTTVTSTSYNDDD